jgi:hypothetical protein
MEPLCFFLQPISFPQPFLIFFHFLYFFMDDSLEKSFLIDYNSGMENRDIKNITDFFSKESPELTPEQKWDLVFEGWIDKIDEKKLMSNLFELKLWFEAMEELFSSTYLENLLFKYQTPDTARDYEFYLNQFSQVTSRIITLLKDLDFEKDRYLLNFEEFIVEKILEVYTPKVFPRILVLQLTYFLDQSQTYCIRINKNRGYLSKNLCFPSKTISQGIDGELTHYILNEREFYP